MEAAVEVRDVVDVVASSGPVDRSVPGLVDSRAIVAGWPADTIAALKTHWDDGLTASQIGALIRKTRNAVLGKVHRLGLPMRSPQDEARKFNVRMAAVRKTRVANTLRSNKSKPLKEAVIVPFSLNPVTLTDLDRHCCKFPVGEHAGQFLFCADASGDATYCGPHAAIAYQPKGKIAAAERKAAWQARRFG